MDGQDTSEPAGAEGSESSPFDTFEQQAPSRFPRVLMWTGLGVVILAGAYVAGQWAVADTVPNGTTVVGLPIGGLSKEAAATELDRGLAGPSAEPVRIVAGDEDASLDPVTAGLRVDTDETLAGLTGFSLSPSHLWRNLFGGEAVDPVLAVDEAAFDAQLEILGDDVEIEPVDGTVVFTEGEANSTPAKDGQVLDAAGASMQIREEWLRSPEPIEVPVTSQTPSVTQENADAAFAEAKRFVSSPIAVEVEEQVAEIPVKTLGEAASYVASDGQLTLELDQDLLTKAVRDRTKDLERKAKNAKFVFKDGKPAVSGGQTGTTLDPQAIADKVREVGTAEGERTAQVKLAEKEPKNSRKKLEALGVKEIVSEFSTPLGASDAARVHNLVYGSERVTGSLILPGETWSLTDTLAPITLAGGYRAAGIVSNGVHQEGVGGGLSQMATTTYNVGFFAGLEDVEHRPHSFWFTRYPEGREATIFVGSIDMRFKNDTPHGIVMQSFVSNGELTVRAWSTPHYRVETSTSGRSNMSYPKTVQKTGAGCISQPAGNPGFGVTVTRKVFLKDEVVRDEAQSWQYTPQNAIVCNKPKPPPKKTMATEKPPAED